MGISSRPLLTALQLSRTIKFNNRWSFQGDNWSWNFKNVLNVNELSFEDTCLIEMNYLKLNNIKI